MLFGPAGMSASDSPPSVATGFSHVVLCNGRRHVVLFADRSPRHPHALHVLYRCPTHSPEGNFSKMKHLKDTTYWKHLRFAWSISGMLSILVVVGIIHGVLPWFFDNLVSSKIKHLHSLFNEPVG